MRLSRRMAMPKYDAKYAGTQEYLLVYGELITAARYRGLISYQDIAEAMGPPLSGSYMGHEVGHILGEISQEEHARGRPLLSALAVSVSGTPGQGFYDLARQLGRLDKTEHDEELSFWEEEKQAVYAAWKRVPKLPAAQQEALGF
jgi:hypothetical protein